MGEVRWSAAERTFATPELLEYILTYLLCSLLPVTDREDPRSVRIDQNARVLGHLMRCSEVGPMWNQCIEMSKRFQRALFLLPDRTTKRAWIYYPRPGRIRPAGSYISAPSFLAPQLNPVIQTMFPAYHFRFWHLSLARIGDKHCAYLIITRRDLPAVDVRSRTGQGKRISDMLLSQPPCTALRATIWEERDETRDYVGRTSALTDATIQCETGVTLGMLHESVSRMFDEHRDVAAIKLTTI